MLQPMDQLLINWLKVRVLPGSQLEPITDVDRFLLSIRFDSREKLQDLMEKGGN